MSSTYYFAYGSNMDARQMRVRCPDAARVSVGTIAGWRFRINTRGVATIVPEDGGTVHGILWRLSETDEQALDVCEGVGSGLYSKKTIDVRLKDGSRLNALVYVAQDNDPGKPRQGYLERILAAALNNSFPPDYIEELRTWASTDV